MPSFISLTKSDRTPFAAAIASRGTKQEQELTVCCLSTAPLSGETASTWNPLLNLPMPLSSASTRPVGPGNCCRGRAF
jgi:hypothetical protein